MVSSANREGNTRKGKAVMIILGEGSLPPLLGDFFDLVSFFPQGRFLGLLIFFFRIKEKSRNMKELLEIKIIITKI